MDRRSPQSKRPSDAKADLALANKEVNRPAIPVVAVTVDQVQTPVYLRIVERVSTYET